MANQLNDEIIFEHAFKDRGGLWRIEEIDPDGKGLASQLLYVCRTFAPDVYVGLVNNPSFNAVATVASGRDLIGLYVGSFEIIHNAFFNLLSRRDCLTSIGDASAEQADSVPANLREPVLSRPIDPTRGRAAMDLAFCACLILYYHELSHIELCHLPFLREHLGVTEYSEMQVPPLSTQHVWLYRTLEDDADISGAVTSARVWKFWYEHMDFSHLDPMGWDRTWVTAAHMLFWIMELLHPPSAGRSSTEASCSVFSHGRCHGRCVKVWRGSRASDACSIGARHTPSLVG